MGKQIYVIDTCVLLDDPNAVTRFEGHDVYLPLAVIDELNDLKTRENVSYHAREVIRTLGAYGVNELMRGASLGRGKGKVFVFHPAFTANVPKETLNGGCKKDGCDVCYGCSCPECDGGGCCGSNSCYGCCCDGGGGEAQTTSTSLPQGLVSADRKHGDDALLEACAFLRQTKKRKVTLVTNDLGLRLRAAANHIDSLSGDEDTEDTSHRYTGIRYVEVGGNGDWEGLWAAKTTPFSATKLSKTAQKNIAQTGGALGENEFVIFTWGDAKIPTIHKTDASGGGGFRLISDKTESGKRRNAFGIEPSNLEQLCALEALCDDSIQLVSLLGAAGTGKTLLAMAVALQKIAEQDRFQKIIVLKPLVAVGGSDIGFLPGSKMEKVGAWLGNFRDNLEQMSQASLEDFVQDGKIEVEALTFIQGRSIQQAFIIIDEAQNLSAREARMIVERCGSDSKVVLLGDPSQVETRKLTAFTNGLVHAVRGAKQIKLAASVLLKKVERSPLAEAAQEIFAASEARR